MLEAIIKFLTSLEVDNDIKNRKIVISVGEATGPSGEQEARTLKMSLETTTKSGARYCADTGLSLRDLHYVENIVLVVHSIRNATEKLFDTINLENKLIEIQQCQQIAKTKNT
jgi:hypothetical protein